jgi:hypothetical protein
LALAGTADSAQRRTTLFDHWHTSMRSTAQKLLARAQCEGAVDTDLTVDDMLALTNAAALAGSSADHARQLLRVQWRGLAGGGAQALP